jgi:hypothetical protein
VRALQTARPEPSKRVPQTLSPQRAAASPAGRAGIGAATVLTRMQRMYGNQFVQRWLREDRPAASAGLPREIKSGVAATPSRLARQGVTSPAAPPTTAGGAPTNSPVARPDRSALRTIADVAINAEYQSGARDGLADFEAIVGSDMDAGAMLVNLAGNIIWAAACFTTGGPAFAISLAGIGVSTVSPAASTNVDRAQFHDFATREIIRITNGLLAQIDRVTAGVDAEATRHGWDDTQTRTQLLQAIFRPEFIYARAASQPSIAPRSSIESM